MPTLVTERLRLIPVTLPVLEAVLDGDRKTAEQLVGAKLPDDWPNDDLVARAFPYSREAIRAEPDIRLWGDSLILLRHQPRVVGSVVFRGHPCDGVAEVGYGIEDGSRGLGLATEATKACVDWAFTDSDIAAVQATTFAWHEPSRRVIAKLGMVQVGTRVHDMLGELMVFERRRPSG